MPERATAASHRGRRRRGAPDVGEDTVRRRALRRPADLVVLDPARHAPDGGRSPVAPAAAALPRRHHAALGGRARLRPRASSTRSVTLGTRRRPDRRRRPGRPAARHRQVQPDHHHLRHPRPRADQARCSTRPSRCCSRAARGRGRCVPGVRHPARRHPRAGLHRPRQRRRPRLRQPAHAPARRDPRVLPAAALPARAGLRDRPLQRRRLQGRRASRPTAACAGSTSSAATSSTAGST